MTCQTAEQRTETRHEEDIDPREDDLGRRKYLDVIVGTDMVQKTVRTHRAKALTKGSGESVEDVHGWRKPLCKPFIAAMRLIQLVGFPLKHGEDSIRRATAVYLVRERVSSKFLPGLLLVLLQSLIENRLKIWSS